MELDRVVLLGRTFEEYRRYFALDVAALKGKAILDVAAGVSSFCAEAHDHGLNVTAADRIYRLAADDIAPRCAQDLDYVLQSLDGLDVYRWVVYRDPTHVRDLRARAYKRFLQDFRAQGHARYIPIDLPKLPFADRQFDLALASYLLLVYEDKLSYEFHRDSIREILRVAGEARIYPIVNFKAERSQYLDRLRADPELADLAFHVVETDFEFLRGSNYYLSITRR